MNAFPYIPDYMIETELGEGGMATVYMGIQQKLQRKVAIKILDPALLKQGNIADRFLIEAQTAANLQHPNIISIFDVGQSGKFYYIVMEYLDGSLKDLIDSSPSGKLPPKESLDIIRKIAPALDYAHGEGIIHRDIKPDNIMFRRDGTPVLVDFGIARAVDSNLNMTKTGMGIGTPHYMSPEQVQCSDLDGRSDFYSLGVVLYVLLTGEKPYDADTILAVALKHLQEPIPKLPESLSYCQPLLDKMMAKNKEDRVQNGTELQKFIDETLKPQPPAQPPQPTETAQPAKYTQSPEFAEPTPSDQHTQLTPLVHPPESTQPTQPSPPDAGPGGESETILSLDMESALKEEEETVSQAITSLEIPLSHDREETPRFSKPKSKLLTMPDRLFSIPNKIAVPILSVFMVIIFVYFLLQGFRSGEDNTAEQQAKTPVPTTVAGQSEAAPETREETGPTEDVIETTPETDAVETRVDPAVKKSPKRNIPRKPPRRETEPVKPAPLLSDDETYRKAAAQNTVEAYRRYLDDYPTGRHVDRAISKMEQLKEGLTLTELRKATSKRTHHLRVVYKTLSHEEVEAMIKRYRFFDDGHNKSGNFRSLFEKQTIKGGTVVVDRKTGLMWHPSGSKSVKLKKINRWIKSLNRRKYAGFSDWRLPTLEEAASLLRPNKNSKGLYTDSIFTGNQKRIWTGDRFGSKGRWVARLYVGLVAGDNGSGAHSVRPVRSIK